MIETLRQILQDAVRQLTSHLIAFLPSLLAALVILAGAYVTAVIVRWLLTRIFKGLAIDRFLRRSGIVNLIDKSGSLRATRLVSGLAFWVILVVGFLTALTAFDSVMANQVIERVIVLLPSLLTGGLILLAGVWLAQYLGRGCLVWAVNEGLPRPRRLAGAVRLVIVFVAVVVAADLMDFAERVFLAAFVIIVGGLMLALSLALGLGGGEPVRRYFTSRYGREEEAGSLERKEEARWTHL
jgi:hypothetical protein